MKKSLESGEVETENATDAKDINSGNVKKERFEAITQEKPILHVFNDLAQNCLLEEWKKYGK